MIERLLLPESLQPGTDIEVGDVTRLAVFEDLIAPIVDPEYDRALAAWEARKPLKELIRPPKFYGRIGGIVLTVMDEPYERLQDATERGWNLGGLSPATYDTARRARYWGFAFTADGMSTGRGIVGQIRSELWYAPLPARTTSTTGRALTRFVAKPKFDVRRFERVPKASRRVAFDARRMPRQPRPDNPAR
jgi:hypothetical protein